MLTEGFYLLVDKRRPLRRRRAFFVLPAGRCFLRRWCALPSSAIVVFVIVVISCRRLAKPVRTIAVGFGSQAENPYIFQGICPCPYSGGEKQAVRWINEVV